MTTSKTKFSAPKWWGWGATQIRFPIEEVPGLVSFLAEKLGVKELAAIPSWDMAQISLLPSTLPDEIFQKVREKLGEEVVSNSREDLIVHAGGKSYVDLVQIRGGENLKAPDVVFYPQNEADLREIFRLAGEYSFALVPFGGGSSVVGGLEARAGNHKYLASVDLRNLNRILQIDPVSHTATVQAGILGPDLERELNEKGFTLGHFPQSFEFSSLGGWIMTRSSGQNSVLYGSIEKNILALKLMTPWGELQTREVPKSATGPSVAEMIVGSEGIFGIVVSATLQIRPKPKAQHYFMVVMPDFDTASAFARTLAQAEIGIAMLRASDSEESQAFWEMSRKKSWKGRLLHHLVEKYIRFRGWTLPGICFVLLGLEGTRSEVKSRTQKVKRILSDFPHINLGTSPGKKWLHERFFLPYLRDELMTQDILVETLETATTWSHLTELYLAVQSALREACAEEKSTILTHISHIYPTGASLYFTVMKKQTKGSEVTDWQRIKKAASDAIVAHHGTISHHHGIGLMHKEYLREAERTLFRNLKKQLDPQGIMNPEKVVDL